MSFPRRKMEDIDVNLTPLIDVVFLLLIFFMVSTTFTKETRLGLELPEAEGETMQAVVEMIEVTVAPSGSYSVNGEQLNQPESRELEQKIQEIAGDNRDIPFIIAADANARHQSVVTVMESAGRLGFVNLSISTKTPSEENK